MPRKKNGWGSSGKNVGFKGINKRTDVAGKRGAAGYYPSDRSFGSVVQRSAIEQFDIDSDWAKWRKGYEFYNQMAWYRLKELDTDITSPTFEEYIDSIYESVLYQGTSEEVQVRFDGYKFSTKEADTNAHYVMKRVPVNAPNLGTVTSIRADQRLYPTNFQNREIWVQMSTTSSTPLLTNMSGDRVTDGVTEATVKRVLTAAGKPALYEGKSEATTVFVEVPTAELLATTFVQENNNQTFSLVGKIGYLQNLYTRRPKTVNDEFIEDIDTFSVSLDSTEAAQSFAILNPEDLSTTVYDISSLDTLYSTNNGVPSIKGIYTFQKNEYQSLFSPQYLTADLVDSEVSEISFGILPFEIKSLIDKTDGFTTIEAEVFPGSLKLYADATNGFFVFTDFSFTKTVRDDYNGNYYHAPATGTDNDWLRLETDVDPWTDEIFTSGNELKPATIFACSCPNYSQAQLAMPQTGEPASGRRNNRQKRYPLPTAKGRTADESVGLSKAAGKISSWENERHRLGFKQCKHTIAARFIERVKTQEPNSYPSAESREKFELKLQKEVQSVGEEFRLSYQRGDISTDELVFALASGLNLDEIELAYTIIQS